MSNIKITGEVRGSFEFALTTNPSVSMEREIERMFSQKGKILAVITINYFQHCTLIF